MHPASLPSIAARSQTGSALCLLVGLACAAALSGCDSSTAQGGPPMAPPISAAPAAQLTVQDSDEFTARIEATQTVEVRARVGGTLESIHFDEGKDVQRGQLLFSIDSSVYKAELERAQAQLASARATAKLTESELERAQKLLAQKAISQQEADQWAANARNTQADVQAAEAAVTAARLNVDFTQIRAPFAGRISRADISVGNLIAPGSSVLTTLVSLDKVYTYFDVSEQIYLRYAGLMRGGAPKPAVSMGLSNESGFPHRGEIDFFDNRLNPATGSMRVRAVFNNPKRMLTPGLFARIRLASGSGADVVLTPDRAIGTDQSKRFVWVVGADNMPQFREVQLGALVNGMRIVSQGLKAGELVVVNGLQRVRPGAPVNAEVLEVDAQGMPIAKPEPGPPPAQ